MEMIVVTLISIGWGMAITGAIIDLLHVKPTRFIPVILALYTAALFVGLLFAHDVTQNITHQKSCYSYIQQQDIFNILLDCKTKMEITLPNPTVPCTLSAPNDSEFDLDNCQIYIKDY